MRIFIALLLLVSWCNGTLLPTQFLSKPSRERTLGYRTRHLSSILNPWFHLFLETGDVLMSTLHDFAEGRPVRVSRLVQSLHATLSRPYGMELLEKAILPVNMNYCSVGHEKCTVKSAVDFVKPVYKKGLTLELILAEYRKRVEFIDFDALHAVHPKRMSAVQLPVQQVLLRLMEGMTKVSAGELRDLFNRLAYSSDSVFVIIGYLLCNSKISSSFEQTTLDLNTGNTLKNILSLPDGFEKALLYKNFYINGLKDLLKTKTHFKASVLDQRLEEKLNVSIKRLPPLEFISYLLFLLGDVGKEFGMNLKVDPSQFSADTDIELLAGTGLDLLRLLYASLQRLIEGDAIAWMTENSKPFYDYTSNLISEDRFIYYQRENFVEVVKECFQDPRTRRLLSDLFLAVCKYINIFQGRGTVSQDFMDRISQIILDPKEWDSPYSQYLNAFIDDPSKWFSITLDCLVSMTPGWVSYVRDWFINYAWGKVDFMGMAITLLGFRVEEFDTLNKFFKSFGFQISYDPIQLLQKYRVPMWSLNLDKDYEPNFDKAFKALLPNQSDFDQSTVYLPMSIVEYFEKLAPVLHAKFKEFDSGLEARNNFDPLPLLLFPRHIAGYLRYLPVSMMTAGVKMSHAEMIYKFVNEIASEKWTSPIGVFFTDLYDSLPKLYRHSQSWILKKLADEQEFYAYKASQPLQTSFKAPGTIRRDIIRTLLLGLSVLMLAAAILILRGAEDVHSFRQLWRVNSLANTETKKEVRESPTEPAGQTD